MGLESRIVGAYYRGESILEKVNTMKAGTVLYVAPEPTNRYDRNAQAVYMLGSSKRSRYHLGYLERALAYKVAMLRDKEGVPTKLSLTATANGFGGLRIEGLTRPDSEFNQTWN